MRYLLDSHVILWLAAIDHDRLSPKCMEIIYDLNNRLFVSVVSLWEIALKMNNGKLDIGIPLSILFDKIQKSSIAVIPIEKEYLLCLSRSNQFTKILSIG